MAGGNTFMKVYTKSRKVNSEKPKASLTSIKHVQQHHGQGDGENGTISKSVSTSTRKRLGRPATASSMARSATQSSKLKKPRQTKRKASVSKQVVAIQNNTFKDDTVFSYTLFGEDMKVSGVSRKKGSQTNKKESKPKGKETTPEKHNVGKYRKLTRANLCALEKEQPIEAKQHDKKVSDWLLTSEAGVLDDMDESIEIYRGAGLHSVEEARAKLIPDNFFQNLLKSSPKASTSRTSLLPQNYVQPSRIVKETKRSFLSTLKLQLAQDDCETLVIDTGLDTDTHHATEIYTTEAVKSNHIITENSMESLCLVHPMGSNNNPVCGAESQCLVDGIGSTNQEYINVMDLPTMGSSTMRLLVASDVATNTGTGTTQTATGLETLTGTGCTQTGTDSETVTASAGQTPASASRHISDSQPMDGSGQSSTPSHVLQLPIYTSTPLVPNQINPSPAKLTLAGNQPSTPSHKVQEPVSSSTPVVGNPANLAESHFRPAPGDCNGNKSRIISLSQRQKQAAFARQGKDDNMEIEVERLSSSCTDVNNNTGQALYTATKIPNAYKYFSSTMRKSSSPHTVFPSDLSNITIGSPADFRKKAEKTPNRPTSFKIPRSPTKLSNKASNRQGHLEQKNSTKLFTTGFVEIVDVIPQMSTIRQESLDKDGEMSTSAPLEEKDELVNEIAIETPIPVKTSTPNKTAEVKEPQVELDLSSVRMESDEDELLHFNKSGHLVNTEEIINLSTTCIGGKQASYSAELYNPVKNMSIEVPQNTKPSVIPSKPRRFLRKSVKKLHETKPQKLTRNGQHLNNKRKLPSRKKAIKTFSQNGRVNKLQRKKPIAFNNKKLPERKERTTKSKTASSKRGTIEQLNLYSQADSQVVGPLQDIQLINTVPLCSSGKSKSALPVCTLMNIPVEYGQVDGRIFQFKSSQCLLANGSFPVDDLL